MQEDSQLQGRNDGRKKKKENRYMQEDSYKGGKMVEKKWT